MSVLKSEEAYLVSSDIGIFHVVLKTVTGFDVEDLVQDKAISQARAVQLLNLGKTIDQYKPSSPRSVSSIFLNNTEEL